MLATLFTALLIAAATTLVAITSPNSDATKGLTWSGAMIGGVISILDIVACFATGNVIGLVLSLAMLAGFGMAGIAVAVWSVYGDAIAMKVTAAQIDATPTENLASVDYSEVGRQYLSIPVAAPVAAPVIIASVDPEIDVDAPTALAAGFFENHTVIAVAAPVAAPTADDVHESATLVANGRPRLDFAPEHAAYGATPFVAGDAGPYKFN